MYFRRLSSPPKQADPDCAKGHDGTALQTLAPPLPHKAAEKPTRALCMTLAATADMATSSWNFPSLSSGTLTAVVRPGAKAAGALGSGFDFNASWALADAALPPWDVQQQGASVFAGAVPQLPGGAWSNLSFAFDLAKGECAMSLNGKASTPARRSGP